jgi:hypothetical protein
MKNIFSGYGGSLLIFRQYLKEIKFLKLYILIVTLLLVLFWGFHLVFTKEVMSKLGKEDGFFEWITASCFLLASLLFFLSFRKTRNLFFLILGIMFFIGFGEEISWGYRIIHYTLPDSLQETNVSKEFNIHNIEIFNTMDLQKQNKHGLERLVEIEFLFKIFTLVYGIVLPLLVYHVNPVRDFTMKIKIPVPPISLGIIFIANYLAFKVCNYCLVQGIDKFNDGYIYSFVETFESLESIVLLAFSFYFYKYSDMVISGKDIKQSIQM